MITSARVEALRKLGGLGWVTALRAPAIAALAADDGPLQMTCSTRPTSTRSPTPTTRGAHGRLPQPRPGHRAGKETPGTAGSHRLRADQDRRRRGRRAPERCRQDRGAGRQSRRPVQDGQAPTPWTSPTTGSPSPAIRTPSPPRPPWTVSTSSAPPSTRADDRRQVVATYKSLARVERDFRSLKAFDVDLRPIHHYTGTRVRTHVFICMLAATWPGTYEPRGRQT
jgi:hypothetical protein